MLTVAVAVFFSVGLCSELGAACTVGYFGGIGSGD